MGATRASTTSMPVHTLCRAPHRKHQTSKAKSSVQVRGIASAIVWPVLTSRSQAVSQSWMSPSAASWAGTTQNLACQAAELV